MSTGLLLRFVGPDSESSRHLLFLVVFSKVVKRWPWILSLSRPGDSVPCVGQHHSPSSPGASKLASSSGFSSSNSLFHDEHWSSASPVHVVPMYGQIAPMPLPSAIVAIESFALTFAFAFVYVGSFVFVTVPIRCADLGAFLFLLSFLHHLFRHSLHSSAPSSYLLGTTSLLRLVLSCLLLYQFCILSTRPHTSSHDMSLLSSWSLCVVLASCVPTLSRLIGTGTSSVGHHYVDDDSNFFS